MTTSSNTSPIKVFVETFYVEGQSDPDNNKYVFAYSISIKNHAIESAQLVRRHWLITDANGKETKVDGDGVVGQQPTIAPGESYTYTSGAVLETPVGTMQGHYIMLDEQGKEFTAPIDVFTLAQPNVLN